MKLQDLSIEQLQEIVDGVPSAKSCISGNVKAADGWDKKQNKYVMCDGVYKFHWVENDWRIYSYSWPEFVLNFISIPDILSRIAEQTA